MKTLITGATGNIGSRVVERLLERGERPRVFVRDADKAGARFGDRVEVAVGDLGDMESLRAALVGMDALFLANSGPELVVRDAEAAKVAKDAGVRRLVKLSSMDSLQGVGTGVWHAQGEAAIRASGVGFAFVQPTGFMSNVLFWAGSIKAAGVVRSTTGDGRIPFIHPEDIAAVAVEALMRPELAGASLAISGPEALSYAEMAERLGRAIGKTVRFEEITEDVVRERMSGAGDGVEVIEAHLSIYRRIREGKLAEVTDTVERVLGRKAISFEEWVEENVGVFG